MFKFTLFVALMWSNNRMLFVVSYREEKTLDLFTLVRFFCCIILVRFVVICSKKFV